MQNQRLAKMLIDNAERFARLRNPSTEDCMRIQKHILENIDLVSVDDRRALAAIFAPIETAPLEIVHFFCDSDETIAAPFVARSPAIDDRMLLTMIRSHGASPRVRAIARRPNLTGPVRAALRALDDPAVDRALELRQIPTGSSRSNRVGERDRSGPTQRLDAGALSQIAALAGDRSRSLFETALADCTGLSMTSARILCDDPTSRNLLLALRFMGFDEEQALSVFRGLSADLANSEDVQERFRSAYAGTGAQEAAERVRRWQLEELEALVTSQNTANVEQEATLPSRKGAA
ncbi:MAG: DUF2336 domain-containing protein [Roseitalea sp.]|jgi:uncharacterized protein (DUF2336 family)|nr:DUF2336 domain-containing protein [Roseitalea sp.]MBO6720515.1 DUF2336 domain-containing protein [Roseitalea sp.]MBO6743662.1 DUF2336 domain-containing protein [Roseitalea sp.]